MVFQLAVVLGDQRIGLRHRRIGHAGDHRAEPDQGMFDAVAGKNRDRTLGVRPRSMIAWAMRRASCAPRRRSPCASAPSDALGQKHPVGRGARPMVEPVGHRARIGLERLGRPHEDRRRRRGARRRRPAGRRSAGFVMVIVSSRACASRLSSASAPWPRASPENPSAAGLPPGSSRRSSPSAIRSQAARGSLSGMRGRACSTAKLVVGVFRGGLSASSTPSPALPSSTSIA